MHAQLKSISSVSDFDTYRPLDAEIFAVDLDLYIGSPDSPGEEVFRVTVCSPGWLAERVEWAGQPIPGKHLYITNIWDSKEVRRTLTAAFEEPEADTWPELGSKLAKLGQWEFEDYEPRRVRGQ